MSMAELINFKSIFDRYVKFRGMGPSRADSVKHVKVEISAGIDIMAEAFSSIEEEDNCVVLVGVSPKVFAELNKIGLESLSTLNSEERSLDLKSMGLKGKLWGAVVCTAKDLPKDEIVCVDQLGKIHVLFVTGWIN